MSGEIAVQIVGIFFGLFAIIIAIVLWFVKGMQRERNALEAKKMQIDVIDKHYDEMIRVECPYCKTLYSIDLISCPNCGAETQKIRFPKIPE
jgi:hypothetical protein